jgi:hypothetical protein
MGTDDRRPSEGLRDHLRDERDAGRAAHEQDGRQGGPVDLGGAEHPVQGADRRLDRGTDHALELRAGERDVGVPVRQEDRDGGLRLDGERLLRQGAVLAQPGERDARARIAQVQFAQRSTDEVVDVREDGVVEVRTAQSLDPLGRPQDLEAVGRAAEDRGIERAAAEVVDRQHLALAERPGGGVVGGRRFGFGGVERLGDPRGPGDVLELLPPERTPVGRMGQGDDLRLGALLLGHPAQHVLQLSGEQVGDGMRCATEHDRGRVAQVALDLAGDPVGRTHGATGGCLAGHDPAVVPDVDGGGRHQGAVTEPEHLPAPVVGDRRGDEAGAEVDRQAVAHRALGERGRRGDRGRAAVPARPGLRHRGVGR